MKLPTPTRNPLVQLSRQELALILVTMFWGTTFVVVQNAMNYAGPLFFVGLRFLTAGMIGMLLFSKSLAGMNRRDLLAGSLIGVGLFAGYALQTHGMQTISGSKSAFITALYVPIVPLLQWAVLRRPPHFMSVVGVVFAFAGLLLLADPDDGTLHLGPGEIATLIGAFAIAAEIILIGHFAGKVDVQRVTIIQLLVAGGLSLLLMPVLGEKLPSFSWVWLLSAVGLGVASIIIQLAMNWAQKSVSPTRATVIYAGEPVWGGLAGRLAGDRLPAIAILGAALIVIGVLVSEMRFSWRRKKVAAGE
ncbi:DMT family transporter [Herbaspirillum sp. alder98]|uniref:DMT family transporter n=1 Tax=Herbaspirillum sp. alder98 TaxID=2913096 RepID=UPI001CD88D52|nr:DMT family transporter [Herbaspirillum sp. alder98]MCA1325076.1 DMT family transporter [Herbaspirillum sp. alder98]